MTERLVKNMKFAGRIAGIAAVAGLATMGVAAPATAAQAHPVTATATASATAQAQTVTEAQWLSDVSTAIDPAFPYIGQRAAGAPGQKLAVVFDIDNTTIETHFHPITEPAVPQSLQLADYAHSLGVAVIFISARPDIIQSITVDTLRDAGYPVDGFYGRDFLNLFEPIQTFKTNERIAVEKQGYTIIANIGNNTSDLAGGHAERTFKLPDYNGLLS